MPFGGLLTAGLISAGTSIAGGLINSNAANKASDTQVQSLQQLIDLINRTTPQANAGIDKATGAANGVLSDTYAKNLALLAPYLNAGGASVDQLRGLLAPGGDLSQKFDASNFRALDPGFDFRVSEGQKALERSAAAKGGSLTGGAVKAAERYGQDYASSEFGNAFNRFQTQQNGTYNRLFGLANLGKSAADSGVAAGGSFASGTSSNLMTSAAEQAKNTLDSTGIVGNALAGQGNARASGYVGSANATTGALGSLGSDATSLLLLSKLFPH